MNNLLNDNSDDDVEDLHGRRDREITLGTTMVLGIFFALAVFGAVCVGFGYSLGSKHAAAVAGGGAPQTGSSAAFANFKPAAGSAGGTGKPGAVEPANIAYTPPPAAALPRAVPATDRSAALAAEATAALPAKPVVVAPVVVAAGKPVVVATPVTPPPAGAMMVQVAAVSHQEDADLLVSTLKRRSYNVAIHQESQDKLLHVQVGPFTNRKDADAMRLRLQADGFNAIVKDNSH